MKTGTEIHRPRRVGMWLGVVAIGVLALAARGYAEATEKPLALLELYTSEGCSSCPRGDQMLAEVQAKQPFKGVTVVPLAFHVDYWDHLGWKDPFGDNAFTSRQESYARITQNRRVYTPQMVVNGKHIFVGGDQESAEKAVLDSASRATKGLVIEVSGQATDSPMVVRVGSGVKPEKGLEVWLAIAEDDLVSDVTRGENKGKKLTHQAVVRKFIRQDLEEATPVDGGYQLEVPWDSAWNRENCRIVGALQSRLTGALVALGQLELGARE